MANIQIRQGDDWAVAIPVYRVRNNYEMWLDAGNSGDKLAYWTAYDTWRTANNHGTEEGFIANLYPDGVPVREVLQDLTGYELTYQLRVDESPHPEVQPVVLTIFPDAAGGSIDGTAQGRFALTLSAQKTQLLKAGGRYTGQLQLVKGGITISADKDTVTVVQDYNYV